MVQRFVTPVVADDIQAAIVVSGAARSSVLKALSYAAAARETLAHGA
jgi:hypothetical protein